MQYPKLLMIQRELFDRKLSGVGKHGQCCVMCIYDSINLSVVLTEGTKLCLIHFIILPTGHQLHQEVFISDGPLQAIFPVRLGKFGMHIRSSKSSVYIFCFFDMANVHVPVQFLFWIIVS